MKKINILVISLVFCPIFSAYKVTVHNNANEDIKVVIKTTQYYPGSEKCSWGLFEGQCLVNRNCGDFKDTTVKKNSTRVFSFYDEVNKVCVGPCTSSIAVLNQSSKEVTRQDSFVGGLTACSSIEAWVHKTDDKWTIITNDWTDVITKAINDLLTKNLDKIMQAVITSTKQKLDNRTAKVRIGNDLSEQEKNITNIRLSKNKVDQEKFLNTKFNSDPLRIAFCGSGGGYRAMISTLGFLMGAQDIGLPALYMSGLSGSTWAIAALITLNQKFEELREALSKNLAINPEPLKDHGFPAPITNDKTIKDLVGNLFIKYYFNQPITFTDIWGALVGNNLFNNLNYTMSEQQAKINTGDLFFPIYTAANPEDNLKYKWFEFSPYEVSFIDNNQYISIPTWSFDRKFNNGSSIDPAPEQRLGFLLGIFGSAYTVSPEEIITMLDLKKSITKLLRQAVVALVKRPDVVAESVYNDLVDDAIKKAIVDPIFKEINKNLNIMTGKLKNIRLSPGEVNNFAFGLPNSSIKNNKTFILVDSGIHFNLPLPPLLRKERKIDAIFVFDSSSDVYNAPDLVSAETYAKEAGLKLPKIKDSQIFKSVNDNTVTIFQGNIDEPIIIYMPQMKDKILLDDTKLQDALNKNPVLRSAFSDKDLNELKSFDLAKCSFCSTFNFKYTKDQFRKLSNLMRFNLIINKDKIKDALISRKNRKKI